MSNGLSIAAIVIALIALGVSWRMYRIERARRRDELADRIRARLTVEFVATDNPFEATLLVQLGSGTTDIDLLSLNMTGVDGFAPTLRRPEFPRRIASGDCCWIPVAIERGDIATETIATVKWRDSTGEHVERRRLRVP